MADSSPASDTTQALRRTHGVYYTPAELAEWMVRVSLEMLLSGSEGKTGKPLQILDPACGAGVFLEQAAKWIGLNSPAEVRWSLCGTDRDAAAIEEAGKNLSAHLSAEVASRLVNGDALAGGDFSGTAVGQGLNWGAEFPEVRRAGGFDLIIGNPPYRREKDAREQFEEIAGTPLGKRWRQARMDLWHYFLHRSLDLLHPEGVLCFVVNSYWTHSRGAQKLIDRLRGETDLLRIVDFDQWPLFAEVQGRHHVFWLRKKRIGEEPHCGVFQISKARRGGDALREVWESLAGNEPLTKGEVTWTSEEFAQRDLYHGGQLIPHRSEERGAAGRRLEELFEVRQGVAENPPTISKRQAALFPELGRAGRGVFVLSLEELAKLNLSEGERALLRPYWETAEVGRYREPVNATKQLLYLTGKTAPSLDDLPAIARHLERFRPLLEARREVKQGKIGWWHLHWPREERLFLQPRIVAVQMGKQPQFVSTAQPAVVGFSCHVVVPREGEGIPLGALCGLLNSTRARQWFETFAKRRGVHLEISGETLRRFPLPGRNVSLEQKLAQLVERRQRASEQGEIADVEGEIERLVEEWVAASA